MHMEHSTVYTLLGPRLSFGFRPCPSLYTQSYCGNEGIPSKTSEFLIESYLNEFSFHRPLNFCIFLSVRTSLFGMVNFVLSIKFDQHSSSYQSLCNHPYNIFEWFTTFGLIAVTKPWLFCTNLGSELAKFNRLKFSYFSHEKVIRLSWIWKWIGRSSILMDNSSFCDVLSARVNEQRNQQRCLL